MSARSLVDVVLEVDAVLAGAGTAHAFGGALALAYYAEPRATVDIDVNVFSTDAAGDRAIAGLVAAGYGPDEPGAAGGFGGVRLRRTADPYPIALFPPVTAQHAEMAGRIRRFPFGPARRALPFLSPEDLVVFKLSFGRGKDWVDVGAVARSGLALDVDYVERQLIGMRGPTMWPRLARLRSILR